MLQEYRRPMPVAKHDWLLLRPDWLQASHAPVRPRLLGIQSLQTQLP
jgi:hypothetical protein